MEATAKKLVDAFAKSGFVYLSNHGLSKEDANKMFSISRQFFDKDLEYKLNLEWESAESNRGYVPQGREKLSELDKAGRAEEIRKLKEINPDLKESYEYGRDDDAQYKNQVPDADWPEFGQQCNEFFKVIYRVLMICRLYCHQDHIHVFICFCFRKCTPSMPMSCLQLEWDLVLGKIISKKPWTRGESLNRNRKESAGLLIANSLCLL